jgi:hypothetical protein
MKLRGCGRVRPWVPRFAAALLMQGLGPACSSSPADLGPPPVGPSHTDTLQISASPNPAVAGDLVAISFTPIRSGGSTSQVGWAVYLSESGFVQNVGSLTGATRGVAGSGSRVTVSYQTVAPTSAGIEVEAWPDQCVELTACSFCCGSVRHFSVTVLPRP